ncbi:CAP domain-containing protein [Streptomyces sp. NPDC048603]|uniref:CAP domain-containing protein n=1 Tax=Streptomyces sp. NPDC048603 TaxID=3365577 RepID=UPI00371F18A5
MGRHRLPAPPRGKRGTAVRTGLLGVSVAVALGTAAVTTGLVPVGSAFPYVGQESDTGRKTEAKPERSPAQGSHLQQQGGLANLPGRAPARTTPPASASASASASVPASPSASASASASPSPSATPTPSATPSTKAPAPTPVKSLLKKSTPRPAATPSKAAPQPVQPVPPAPPTGHSAEETAVLNLVNQERAAVGCPAVRANPPLAALAGAFSKDMAVRGFFDHTDPDGRTPWDRAAQAGLSGMAAENIARGQGDAASVMKGWMNSPGHRANILNCEYRTLGVGMYDAPGGPWWTQDFGI